MPSNSNCKAYSYLLVILLSAFANNSKNLQLVHFKCLPHSSSLFNTCSFFLSFNWYLIENLDKHLCKSNYFAIFPSCSHSILLRNRPLIFKICPKSILTHAQQPKPEFSGSDFGTSLSWWERCLSKYREWKIYCSAFCCLINLKFCEKFNVVVWKTRSKNLLMCVPHVHWDYLFLMIQTNHITVSRCCRFRRRYLNSWWRSKIEHEQIICK